MTDWALIETTIESWIESVTGLPADWEEMPRSPSFSDAGHIILSIRSPQTVGMDDLITVYDDTEPAGEEIEITQKGARTFVLGCQIRTWGHSATRQALQHSTKIRDSLSLPQITTNIWAAADIAFARILADNYVGTMQDGRMMSVHQLDILVNASSTDQDDTPTGYVVELEDFELYDNENPTPPLWTGDIEVE